MQDEMGGQSPEEMGLQPEDLKTDSDQKEDKSSGFFNKARTEAWKAMGETDQLAIVTQKLEGKLGPDEVGFTVEVFSGSPRTEVGKPEGKNVVIVSENTDQAIDIKNVLPEQQILIADSNYLPFKDSSIHRFVDPHKVSEVGERELESPTKNAAYLYSELKALLKEKRGKPGFLAERPVYVGDEEHGQLVEKFRQSLTTRAQVLKPDGKLIFSVGVRPEEIESEGGYMAVQKQVGEVVLSPSEVKQLIQQSGLQIEEAYAGMASRSQMIQTESAIKALVISVTSGRFDRFSQEILLPVAHALWNFVGRPRELGKDLSPDEIRDTLNLQKVDLDNFEQSKPSGPAGARMKEGETKPPDRVILVASKAT